jgi:hypothetical protein
MGKKAKANNTTPETPPLDDDAKWIPLVEAVEHLIKLTRSQEAALRRIETANLPTVSEDVTTGERKYEQPEFWKTNFIFYTNKEPSYAAVVPGSRADRVWRIWADDPRNKVGGRIYFLSRSHFGRLSPATQPLVNEDEQMQKQAVRPGPKPTDDWDKWVARWLILKATESPNELRNVDALVEEVRDWLETRKRFAPKDNKEIRKQIADLLQLIRR